MKPVDLLIVGGGLAGLNAAAAAAAAGCSFVVADAGGGASSEIMGFSAPVNPGDSPELFYEDTLRAGGGKSDPALVRLLADRAIPEFRRLEALGIAFDRTPEGHYDMVNALGSTVPRVVHAGTSTGKQAIELLKQPVLRTRVVKLLLSGGRIAGALFEDGETIAAKAVILAGGGFAGLWSFSSWGKALRGDALLLALEAGADFTGLGEVQFEPTVTVHPEKWAGFPVITTVLSEGARLRNRHGDSLLAPGEAVPRKRELAERIFAEIRRGNALPHGGLWYDFSGVDEELFRTKYPGYYRKFQALAPRFNDLGFEVKPGAHTTLGGIRIDTACATRIPGLFAAGEAVGGIHGRDRLGGNAGLEVFVFGRIAGASAARYAKRTDFAPLSSALPPPLAPYAGAAAILDRYLPVAPAKEELAAGLAELKRLPRHPLTQLLQMVFEDRLRN